MNNVTHLDEYRARRQLPPAAGVLHIPLIERMLLRYRKFNKLRHPPIAHKTAFRGLAVLCAKRLVHQLEVGEIRVADDARFQFFASGHPGAEVLRVRVNRVGPLNGPAGAQSFEIDCETLEARRLEGGPYSGETFKPLLTLPMTLFFRLR